MHSVQQGVRVWTGSQQISYARPGRASSCGDRMRVTESRVRGWSPIDSVINAVLDRSGSQPSFCKPCGAPHTNHQQAQELEQSDQFTPIKFQHCLKICFETSPREQRIVAQDQLARSLPSGESFRTAYQHLCTMKDKPLYKDCCRLSLSYMSGKAEK